MNQQFANLSEDTKVYLASDFHFGVPNMESSRKREEKVIAWLNAIENDASGIILVGDIFDFWFEYRHVVPKGHLRFFAKILSLRKRNIPVIFFTGNHDLWMKDYLKEELDINIYTSPETFQIGNKIVYVGHGDGLGPGDRKFKFFKGIFTSSLAQWAFRWFHPDLGIALAKKWSASSREDPDDLTFLEEKEWLIQHSREIDAQTHHDLYIYGHRHHAIHYPLSAKSDYYNLGEWVTDSHYLEISSTQVQLIKF